MIRLSGIKKRFGTNEVLKGIDLEAASGEVVAILGPSGSGKSTLLRCINVLERADEGFVQIGEHTLDLRKANRKEILAFRRRTAMVFQHYNLFRHMTALQNVAEALVTVRGMSKPAAREKSIRALEQVGLGHKLNEYPSRLSGGQQQRVGIARALALDPEVLLLDEPTSSLDPELVSEVLDTIRSIAEQGITMLIVTHELTFAKEVADKTVFMENGVIVEEGRSADLFDRPRSERTRQFLQHHSGHRWTTSRQTIPRQTIL